MSKSGKTRPTGTSRQTKVARGGARQKQAFRASQRTSSSGSEKAQARETSADSDVTGTETDSQLVPYDENLLERSRTQWQFGDWESLAQLGRGTLQHHPDRASLALLSAAGHLQQGNTPDARQFLRLAQNWGCSKRVISQVLIAGVYNSLGRAAVLTGQESRALSHFENSIVIGTPGSDVRLASRARITTQIEHIEMASDGNGHLRPGDPLIAPASRTRALSQRQKDSSEKADTTFSAEAYTYYQTISQISSDKDSSPFILLDSKSLPRSGLHYVKDIFEKVLGRSFSFCEWYQEPGCCKKMPCALTAYAQRCTKARVSGIRLTKSHDFNLNDPLFAPIPSVRRPILVRDPLFILTSWYALDCLAQHRDALLASGIDIRKIWHLHESEIVAAAYQLLDEIFVPPGLKHLNTWLWNKIPYITEFIAKWLPLATRSSDPFCNVVRYEHINIYAAELFAELHPRLPPEAQVRIDQFMQRDSNEFQPRRDPFQTPSSRVAAYLNENSHAFIEAANYIADQDTTGILRQPAASRRPGVPSH